ncbi:MAG: EF-hand domain-containing protein [Rhodothalassiaceae bacterium]
MIRSVYFMTMAGALVLSSAGAATQRGGSGETISEDVCSVFEVADLNDDGRLHLAEYVEFFVTIPEVDLSDLTGRRFYGDPALDKRAMAYRVYERLDQNGDGFVSVAEFQDRMDRIDLDFSRYEMAEGDAGEYAAGLKQLQERDQRILFRGGQPDDHSQQRLFGLMDRNDNRVLSPEEIRAYVSIDTYGCDISGLDQIAWANSQGDDVSALIDDLDADDDGRVTFAEYRRFSQAGTERGA